MSVFEEIKVGDQIVIRDGGRAFGRDTWPLTIEQVTKVTATQITAGGIRFIKRSGFEYGEETRIACRIETVYQYGKPERLMTVEEAEARNREVEQELRRDRLAAVIADQATRSNLKKLPYETLVELAEVLGMVVGDKVEE